MNLFIEAIYEGGVFRPLVQYDNLKEHKRYRLMLVEEVTRSETSTDDALIASLASRTTMLPDGRAMINLLGLFDTGMVNLSFEDIEATLHECYQEQAREWNDVESSEECL